MRNTFERKFYLIFTIFLAVLATVIFVAVAFSERMEERNSMQYLMSQNFSIDTEQIVRPTEVEVQEEKVIVQKNSGTQRAYTPTEKNTEKATDTTEKTKVTMATAPTQDSTSSYKEQWDKGYLLALDYPDIRYNPRHVELSDETRAIVESICMAENQAGDFIGAALVAQSLKNAIIYYGTDDVLALLNRLHFSGSRNNNVSKDVRDAVIYIFDMDKNAVQHRIFYNYKPKNKNKLSDFHEGKEYVCTYKNIRFFDE